MEEKKNRLRNAIKSNPNLSEEFKNNVVTLTDSLVEVFPDYDYSALEGVLSSMSVVSAEDIEGYASYDRDTRTLGINIRKITEDIVDPQHLFLNEILQASTNTMTGYEGFKTAVTESISTLMNNDNSVKKILPEEHLLISIFSKIVDPKVIISSYMNGSVVDVIAYLDTLGISKQEFDDLAKSFNELHTDNNAFTTAEIQMINMYGKVIDIKMRNGEMKREEASKKLADFSTQLIYRKSTLISSYPRHNFSNLEGFENVELALAAAAQELESKANELSSSDYSK